MVDLKTNPKWGFSLFSRKQSSVTKPETLDNNQRLKNVLMTTAALESSMGLNPSNPPFRLDPKILNKQGKLNYSHEEDIKQNKLFGSSKSNWTRSFKKVSKLVLNQQNVSSPPLSPATLPLSNPSQNTYFSDDVTVPISHTAYVQSIRKLKGHQRRPLIQLVLIHHVVTRIQSADNSLDLQNHTKQLQNPARNCHRSGIRSNKRVIRPTINQIFALEEKFQVDPSEIYKEDDNIPIALLHKNQPINIISPEVKPQLEHSIQPVAKYSPQTKGKPPKLARIYAA